MVSMLVDTCLGYVLMSFKLVFSTMLLRWGLLFAYDGEDVAEGAGIA